MLYANQDSQVMYSSYTVWKFLNVKYYNLISFPDKIANLLQHES